MREQLLLRVALAASALVCSLHFFPTRESIDIVAAALFVLVTYSTGQRRSGAFLGAGGASAAVLVVRVHQHVIGGAALSALFALNIILPAAALVLAFLARRRLKAKKFSAPGSEF